MIWQPKIGQIVVINYKDKSMYYQAMIGTVKAFANGQKTKNALIELSDYCKVATETKYIVVPRGNLIAT